MLMITVVIVIINQAEGTKWTKASMHAPEHKEQVKAMMGGL